MQSRSSAPNVGAYAKDSLAGSTAGIATGTAIGGSHAGRSLTVLGSHAIGGLAPSFGLISAPLCPVIAGWAVGLAVGYAGLKTVRLIGRSSISFQ